MQASGPYIMHWPLQGWRFDALNDRGTGDQILSMMFSQHSKCYMLNAQFNRVQTSMQTFALCAWILLPHMLFCRVDTSVCASPKLT
mmetsp:Transcript_42242/g.80765  ORF Transcript_42242/g.80765 Transcript_42242/m.80765 type:complete len:86 (+) Transcript_42242:3-260(+)